MPQYLLTCCSTADLPFAYFQKRNIPYVCFHFILDGKEYPDDLGKSVPFDVFYRRIEEGALPTTAQVNIQEFIQFFEPFLVQGLDILHISLSSGLSGTYHSALLAREQLLQKYPDRQIYIVDSLGASSGSGLLVDLAADLRDEGASLDEIYTFIEENKLNIHHWFFSSNLAHYRRGGRLSAASATIGTILAICPLMNMNQEGKLIMRAKVRGKNQVITEMVRKMREHAQDGANYAGKCFISHSACYEEARKLADLIEECFPLLNGRVMINNVGTVIGSHTGPGTVALFFFGDKRIN